MFCFRIIFFSFNFVFILVSGNLTCSHTVPNAQGRVLVPTNDHHCCGCNAGEYAAELCKGKDFENTTVCKPCSFDVTNPANQTYTTHGPHLNKTCSKSVESCNEREVRLQGSKCFPARCVTQSCLPPTENDANILTIVLGVLCVFLLLTTIVPWVYYFQVRELPSFLERRNTRTRNTDTNLQQNGNPPTQTTPLLPLTSSKPNGSPQNPQSGPVTPSSTSSQKQDDCMDQNEMPENFNMAAPKSNANSFQPTGRCGSGSMQMSRIVKPERKPTSQNEDAVVNKIKLYIGMEMTRNDRTKFLRKFGAKTSDFEEVESQNLSLEECFNRVFEQCQRRECSITAENIQNYLEENRLQVLADHVSDIMDKFKQAKGNIS